MTSEGHLLHVESAGVVCSAKNNVSSGCSLELRHQDSNVLQRCAFTMHPFESYSNGHLILRSLFLTICRKFRKYARTLSNSTFVDPECVKKMQHTAQVPLLICLSCFVLCLRTLHNDPASVCYIHPWGRQLAAVVS
jgi:hypothetical protein